MNNSTHPEYTIHTAQALYTDLVGLKINDQQFLEFANIGMEKIGKNIEPVKVVADVEDDGYCYLPCDAKQILSVTDDRSHFDSWEYSYFYEGEISFNRMGDRAIDRSPSLHADSRSYIDFNFMPPNKVRVDKTLAGEAIYIAAKMLLQDISGNYLINLKQAEALCYYVAYLKTQRDAFAGIQGIDLQYIRQRALNAITDARIPDEVSDNELDRMLDARASFGRKSFNKDFIFRH
jgi:hypothetical protein